MVTRSGRLAGGGSDADSVALYLGDIGRHPLLTRAQEVALAQIIEAGRTARLRVDGAGGASASLDPAALRAAQECVQAGEQAVAAFVRANLRLVVSIARRYKTPGTTLADLIQDGNLGLIHAVEKFDWRRGFKFSTYATWWIRQAITRGIDRTGRPIRLPIHAAGVAADAYRLQNEWSERHGRTVTTCELARALEVTEAFLAAVLATARPPRSLSETLGGRDDGELVDILRDPAAVSPAQAAVDAARATELDAVLVSCLDGREREILRLRFGLDGEDPRTLDQVGARFGISRERVRQIERAAFNKLRHPQFVTTTRALLDG
jgi:RNA polymerase sigma factor (sigma-70 family)